MKLLSLIGLSVLLSYGVVEAGEKHKPGDTWPKSDGCNTCEMDQYGTSYCTTLYCRGKNLEFENEPLPRELATCDPDMTKCETPCEKKMREAMKAMDKIMRGDWVHTPYNTYEYQSMVPNAQERELWENVMKTCVRP